MLGRLNHVAIAVPDLAAGIDSLSRHSGRQGFSAAGRTRARRDRGVRGTAQYQDRTARAPGRDLADPRLSRKESGGRHPSCLLRGGRHHGGARPAEGARARAFSATASPRSAPMASRCCSCTPRISAARWWSSNRHEADQRHCHLFHHLVGGTFRWCCRGACATPHESGEPVEEGNDPGAPVNPQLLRKAVITTDPGQRDLCRSSMPRSPGAGSATPLGERKQSKKKSKAFALPFSNVHSVLRVPGVPACRRLPVVRAGNVLPRPGSTMGDTAVLCYWSRTLADSIRLSR